MRTISPWNKPNAHSTVQHLSPSGTSQPEEQLQIPRRPLQSRMPWHQKLSVNYVFFWKLSAPACDTSKTSQPRQGSSVDSPRNQQRGKAATSTRPAQAEANGCTSHWLLWHPETDRSADGCKPSWSRCHPSSEWSNASMQVQHSLKWNPATCKQSARHWQSFGDVNIFISTCLEHHSHSTQITICSNPAS